MIDRRDLLRALGASAAAGALAALGGCGRGGRGARAEVTLDPRSALRDAVAQVRARYAAASGWMLSRERTTLLAGSDARDTARHDTVLVVLRGRTRDGAVVEMAGDDASPDGLGALAGRLAALGDGAGGGALRRGRAVDHTGELDRDPAAEPVQGWLADLDDNLRRAEALGTSRIVWRAAHAVIDDERVLFVGDDRDVAQRMVRIESGLAILAWHGTDPRVGEVLQVRAAGLEGLALADDAIEAATARALDLLTPGEVATGPVQVRLDPSVVAALIGAGIGEVAAAHAWARPDLRARALVGTAIAAPGLTIADAPDDRVDDDGAPTARAALIDAGALTGGLAEAGTARRRRDDGALVHRATHLVVSAGTDDDAALAAAVGDGVLIEDGVGATVDPATWRVTVRARRARRLAGGRPTGHAWSDVELRGALPELLGGVTAIGAALETHPVRGQDDALPPIRVSAPALVTRGELTTGRGDA